MPVQWDVSADYGILPGTPSVAMMVVDPDLHPSETVAESNRLPTHTPAMQGERGERHQDYYLNRMVQIVKGEIPSHPSAGIAPGNHDEDARRPGEGSSAHNQATRDSI